MVRRRGLHNRGSLKMRAFLLRAREFELLDGQIGGFGEDRLRDYWTAHCDELLAEFVPQGDCTKPFGWHLFEGPHSEWTLARSRRGAA